MRSRRVEEHAADILAIWEARKDVAREARLAHLRPRWLAIQPGSGVPMATLRPWVKSIRTAPIWGATWAAPLKLVLATLGRSRVLWDIGSSFSQLAVVTFGGAYVVLAYMARESVVRTMAG